MEEKLIDIKNLEVHFPLKNETIKAVDDVTWHINKGETVAIVGESGSGKSVTAMSLMRLTDYSGGKINSGSINFSKLNGDFLNLSKLSQNEMRNIRGKDISMIFQEPMTSLNPVLKISTQMNEILIKHDGLNDEEATQKSIEMLKAVGIPEPERRIYDYPHQFSGGMRQRIMIAMALQCNPALLIADEPTTALDVTIQAQILDLMMDLKDSRKDAAILLITHDLAVIAETCDRVIVMYGGVIQEIATINELFKNPIHPYTKALMDSIPKMDTDTKRLKALKGMVPSILDLGDECKLCSRFDPEDCACLGTTIEPDLIQVSEGHFARVNPDILK